MRRKSGLIPATGPPLGYKTSYEGQLGTSGRVKPYYQNWWQATNWSIPAMWNGRTAPNKTYSDIASLSALLSSGLVDGDWCAPTASFTWSTASSSNTVTISLAPTNGIRIDFGSPAGTHVTFGNTNANKWAAVLFSGAQNLFVSGGEYTANPAAWPVSFRGNCNNIWLIGGYVHNSGMEGISLVPVTVPGAVATIQNCRIAMQVRDWGNVTSYDAHSEKGTGLHACTLGNGVSSDGTNTAGSVNNNVVAIFGTEPGLTAGTAQTGGAVLEIGIPTDTSPAGGTLSGNAFFVFGAQLNMHATTQSAGNGLNVWGGKAFANTSIEYLEHRDSAGRAFNTHGLYTPTGIIDGGKVTIKHGLANNTNQSVSPADSHDASNVPFQTYGSPTYHGDIKAKSNTTATNRFNGVFSWGTGTT